MCKLDSNVIQTRANHNELKYMIFETIFGENQIRR